MIRRIAVFGATGDLTPRYLLTALARLYETCKLPEGFEILGLARDDWDTETFRGFIEERLAEHAADVATPARSGLVKMLVYHRADATDREQGAKALGPLRNPSLPTSPCPRRSSPPLSRS